MIIQTHCPNVSTTPITAMGCRQCLPLSVVELKGKDCRKPHCRNGVVDTFVQYLFQNKLPDHFPLFRISNKGWKLSNST